MTAEKAQHISARLVRALRKDRGVMEIVMADDCHLLDHRPQFGSFFLQHIDPLLELFDWLFLKYCLRGHLCDTL